MSFLRYSARGLTVAAVAVGFWVGCFESNAVKETTATNGGPIGFPPGEGLCVGVTPPASMFLPLPEIAVDAGSHDVKHIDGLTLDATDISDGAAEPTDHVASTEDGDATPGDALISVDAPMEISEITEIPDIMTESPDSDTEINDLGFSTELIDTTDAEIAPDDAANEEVATSDAQTASDTLGATNRRDASEGGWLPDMDLCNILPGTCVGSPGPEWALFDFQPQSCGYRATYGLKQFVDHVTVVVLLAAW